MKTPYIAVNGKEAGIDFDAHYQVKGWRGIAFYLLGWAANEVPIMVFDTDEDGNEFEVESDETELAADPSSVVAVMVGDDRRHVVAVDDLIALPEDGFCRECGQVGCKCSVYA